MTDLVITGGGAVSWAGLGLESLRAGLAGTVPFATEEPLAGQPVQVGRVGRLEDPGSAASYKRWGQLDTYSRYGFVAARLALEDAGFGPEDASRERVGVLLGTAFGCMEENQRFDRYKVADGQLKGASPLLFKGTVDNAPAGWVAVANRLKGPNATFVSGDGAALEALWSAVGVLGKGRAPGLVVGGVERFVDLHQLLRRRDPSRHGEILSEGAGVVVVERADDARRRGARVRARLLGVERRCGELDSARRSALQRLAVAEADVGLYLPATPDGPKRTLGESHGAWGGLALCAALAQQEQDGWNGRPVALIHAFGEGTEHFFAAISTIGEQQA